VIGFGLLAVEIFILPGFGIAGIAGIGLLIIAFTFSMLGNEGFDFSGVSKDVILRSLAIVVISMFSAIIVSYFLAARLIKTNRFGRLVLKGTMNSSEGYVSSDSALSQLIGKKGVTLSFLRPSGKVSIDGSSYTANAENYFIESGKIIVVTRFDGINIWVAESDK
jgi:membrane-bound serine protease (ClpP class)